MNDNTRDTHIRAAVLLRTHRLRSTAVRRAVLDVLLRAGDSELLTARVITSRATGLRPDIHKSTIYRTLDALVDRGVLTVTNLGESAQRFQLTCPPDAAEPAPERPAHARCSRCDEIFEVPASALDSLAAQLERDLGFQLDPARTALVGRCADCRPA